MEEKKLADIRNDYKKKQLNENEVLENPYQQLQLWVDEAIASKLYEPTAFCLSTVGKNNIPSSRIVLLKGIDENGLCFFTNYSSHKGVDLEMNPNAAINFFWPELERQTRIQGTISKVPSQLSDEYFSSRPRLSQIGAIASQQSSIIPSREYLENKFQELEKSFEGQEIKRPSNWGGYFLKPFNFEFWQGRQSRLHDRLEYYQIDQAWKIRRLSP